MASIDELYGMPKRKPLTLLDMLYGAGEMATQLGTGTLAQFGGGLAYLPAAAIGGDKAGQAVMNRVSDAYTYQPTGAAATMANQKIGDFVAPIAKSGSVGAQTFADNVYSATGSPLLGAAARTAPSAIDLLADRLRLGKAMPKNNVSGVESKISKSGIDIDISESRATPNVITVHRIVVPKESRSSGIGTSAMQDIISHADENGKTVALSPSTDFGATSVARLKEFYKRFGFVENKGRNKDFTISETMYRNPAK